MLNQPGCEIGTQPLAPPRTLSLTIPAYLVILPDPARRTSSFEVDLTVKRREKKRKMEEKMVRRRPARRTREDAEMKVPALCRGRVRERLGN
jgi:hypothetical protein